MALTLNATHDPARRSWVDAANLPDADFPLQNLPYGAFTSNAARTPRLGVAIGDKIFDFFAASHAGLLPEPLVDACRQPTLNALLALGAPAWTALRTRISDLLSADAATPTERDAVATCLVPQRVATLHLAVATRDYTDFYASIHHATNVGSMLRPENPLLPNYKWIPIGYHGRASSLVVSGTAVRRPHGQLKPAATPGAPEAAPVFAPCKNFDYELELAAFVGPGNQLGERIPLAAAPQQLFGVSLLNDWSARDIQTWEYQPLGPFLAKNFASSLSPWVVTLEALAPFRTLAFARAASDPAPLPYLVDHFDAAFGGLDVTLEAWILTAKMRLSGEAPYRISRGNFTSMYWTLGQLLAHHASNGCNLSPGDLLGSGTVSGPTRDSRGCLLEYTWRGSDPLRLPNGEERKFLADGDEVILRGYAERAGAKRIGLGECRGVVLPAS